MISVPSARCTAPIKRAPRTMTNQAAACGWGAANRRRTQSLAALACAGNIAQTSHNVSHIQRIVKRAAIAPQVFVLLSGAVSGGAGADADADLRRPAC